jgi:hypothetical protein
MEFIENTFYSENELEFESAKKMVDEIAVITQSYNSFAETYDAIKPNLTERRTRLMKHMAFHMRD